MAASAGIRAAANPKKAELPKPRGNKAKAEQELAFIRSLMSRGANGGDDFGGACGFDEDECDELAAQGIAPWDPDAAAALAVLRGDGGFDDAGEDYYGIDDDD